MFLICVFVLRIRAGQTRIAERIGLQQSFDRYQIGARSERLCRAALPSTGDVQLLADIDAPARNGDSRPYWNVECCDAGGKEIANLIWEGDTGQLRSFSSLNLPTRRAALPVLRWTAAERALRWLETLEADAPGERWRLLRPPALEGNNWLVCFQSGSHKVRLYVEARSGALVYAHSWP
jgi:hypothetical protein